jgi:hypothetical protein
LPYIYTPQCNDGWFSYSRTEQGTCAGHRGVMLWVVRPPATPGQVLFAQQQAACLNAGGCIPPNARIK